jgi:hypothetical protein
MFQVSESFFGLTQSTRESVAARNKPTKPQGVVDALARLLHPLRFNARESQICFVKVNNSPCEFLWISSVPEHTEQRAHFFSRRLVFAGETHGAVHVEARRPNVKL